MIAQQCKCGVVPSIHHEKKKLKKLSSRPMRIYIVDFGSKSKSFYVCMLLFYTKTVPFCILSIEGVIKFPLIIIKQFFDRDLLE